MKILKFSQKKNLKFVAKNFEAYNAMIDSNRMALGQKEIFERSLYSQQLDIKPQVLHKLQCIY